jgi:hypothetical protein
VGFARNGPRRANQSKVIYLKTPLRCLFMYSAKTLPNASYFIGLRRILRTKKRVKSESVFLLIRVVRWGCDDGNLNCRDFGLPLRVKERTGRKRELTRERRKSETDN